MLKLRQLRMPLLACVLLQICGCISMYGATTTLSRESRGIPFDETDWEAATRAAVGVAKRYNLVPKPQWVLDGMVQDQGFKAITQYSGYGTARASLEGKWAQIAITVSVVPDGSGIRITVNDLDSSHETAYFRLIRAELKAALEDAFPDERVEFESGRIGGTVVGP